MRITATNKKRSSANFIINYNPEMSGGSNYILAS